jgi:hypothetical protein
MGCYPHPEKGFGSGSGRVDPLAEEKNADETRGADQGDKGMISSENEGGVGSHNGHASHSSIGGGCGFGVGMVLLSGML